MILTGQLREIFCNCSNLDLCTIPLEKWDVSNVYYFVKAFSGVSLNETFFKKISNWKTLQTSNINLERLV